MNFVAYQVSQLSAALIFGMLLALYYDLYRFSVILFKIRKLMLSLSDLLWWLSVLIFFSYFWYVILAGDMRLTLFLWQALGFLLFRVYISPYLKKIEKKIFSNRRSNNIDVDNEKLAQPCRRGVKVINKPFALVGRGADFLGKSIWLSVGFLRKKQKKIASMWLFSSKKEENPPDDN